MIPRSYLYVPGTRADRFTKALESGADAVIFDLEDAVAPAEKEAARRLVGDFLGTLRPVDRSPLDERPWGDEPERWVRTNPGPAGLNDLSGVLCAQLDGVCPAKTRSISDLLGLGELLHEADSRALLEPLVEDAGAVLDARSIASDHRVRRLHLGEGDLAADLGLLLADRHVALAGARYQIVLASAAAGVEPPVAPVSPDYRDLELFEEETRYMRSLGFWGRACIHPAQVAVANEVFSLSHAEVEWADDVLRRLERASTDGDGVTLGADGQMVDEAVARIARRLLGRTARGRPGAEATTPGPGGPGAGERSGARHGLGSSLNQEHP